MSVSGATTLAGEILASYEAVRRHSPQNEAISKAWAMYWGTHYGSREFWFAYAEYLGKLTDLDRQIELFCKDTRSLQLFSNALTRLRASFDPIYLQNQTAQLSNLDETFNIIHLASAILPTTMNDPIEPLTIEGIGKMLDEMMGELERAEIDSQLSQFLRGNMSFLRWAVANYATLGTDGLSKAYGLVASEFIRAWGKRAPENPSSESWWQSARSKMKLIGEGVIWSEKLASGAEKLLTHGDDVINLLT